MLEVPLRLRRTQFLRKNFHEKLKLLNEKMLTENQRLLKNYLEDDMQSAKRQESCSSAVAFDVE